MKKASHINQLVSCQQCPLRYCIICQPKGCKCGCLDYMTDHNDITGKGTLKQPLMNSSGEQMFDYGLIGNAISNQETQPEQSLTTGVLTADSLRTAMQTVVENTVYSYDGRRSGYINRDQANGIIGSSGEVRPIPDTPIYERPRPTRRGFRE